MTKSPKTRRVFKPGHRNVVLNWRNSPDSEFGFYGHAFHDAGQKLANDLLSARGYSDLEALPILYLYRHSLELYLKAILIIGNDLLSIDGKQISESELRKVLDVHRLAPFVPHLKAILEATGAEWHFPDSPEITTFEGLKRVLSEVDEIDAGSYTFRYPTKKDGRPSLPHHFTFDLVTSLTVLDSLVEALDAALSHLNVTWDNVCDALQVSGET